MAADGGADAVDLNLAVELGETFLHQARHGLRILHEMCIRDRAATRARQQIGRARILRELAQKGVDRESAERAVERCV